MYSLASVRSMENLGVRRIISLGLRGSQNLILTAIGNYFTFFNKFLDMTTIKG